MGRKLKYPALEKLKIGEALILPAIEVDNIATLRTSVKGVADRRRINLSVHDRGDTIEIARYPSTADEVTEAVIRQCSVRLQFDEEHMRKAWFVFLTEYISENRLAVVE